MNERKLEVNATRPNEKAPGNERVQVIPKEHRARDKDPAEALGDYQILIECDYIYECTLLRRCGMAASADVLSRTRSDGCLGRVEQRLTGQFAVR